LQGNGCAHDATGATKAKAGPMPNGSRLNATAAERRVGMAA